MVRRAGFHLITPDMDVDKFRLQIGNGVVFIHDKYLEVSDEKSNSNIIQGKNNSNSKIRN